MFRPQPALPCAAIAVPEGGREPRRRLASYDADRLGKPTDDRTVGHLSNASALYIRTSSHIRPMDALFG